MQSIIIENSNCSIDIHSISGVDKDFKIIGEGVEIINIDNQKISPKQRTKVLKDNAKEKTYSEAEYLFFNEKQKILYENAIKLKNKLFYKRF